MRRGTSRVLRRKTGTGMDWGIRMRRASEMRGRKGDMGCENRQRTIALRFPLLLSYQSEIMGPQEGADDKRRCANETGRWSRCGAIEKAKHSNHASEAANRERGDRSRVGAGRFRLKRPLVCAEGYICLKALQGTRHRRRGQQRVRDARRPHQGCGHRYLGRPLRLGALPRTQRRNSRPPSGRHRAKGQRRRRMRMLYLRLLQIAIRRKRA